MSPTDLRAATDAALAQERASADLDYAELKQLTYAYLDAPKDADDDEAAALEAFRATHP
jgi:hypothetical protein